MGAARLRGTLEERRAAALARAEAEREVGRAVHAWLRRGRYALARPGEPWAEMLRCEAEALGFDAAWWARERLVRGRAARAPARSRPLTLSLLLAAAALRWPCR